MKTLTKNFIAVLLLATSTAHSATWFIDSGATGTNDGTSWANAWPGFSSINWSAISKNESHTIFISGGSSGKTYTQTLAIAWANATGSLTFKVGQEAGRNGMVTITPPAGVGIKFGTDTEFASPFSFDAANNVKIDGEVSGVSKLTVTGTKGQGIYFRFGGGTNNTIRYVNVDTCGFGTTSTHGIRIDSGDITNLLIENCNIVNNAVDGLNWPSSRPILGNVTVRDCLIAHNRDDGLQMGGGVDVYNCIFDGTGNTPTTSFHPDGIQGSTGFWRIYNNVFGDHTQEVFIQSEPATNSGTLQDVYIYNNVFVKRGTGNSKDIILSMNAGVVNAAWTNIVLANNTHMSGNVTMRILAKSSAATITLTNSSFENNIIGPLGSIGMNNNGEGVTSWAVGGFVARNNLFLSPVISMKWQGVQCTSVAALHSADTGCVNNLSGVATFVSPVDLNFRVTAGDPINKGRTQSLFSVDADGKVRQEIWDIGAYESGASAPRQVQGFRILQDN